MFWTRDEFGQARNSGETSVDRKEIPILYIGDVRGDAKKMDD